MEIKNDYIEFDDEKNKLIDEDILEIKSNKDSTNITNGQWGKIYWPGSTDETYSIRQIIFQASTKFYINNGADVYSSWGWSSSERGYISLTYENTGFYPGLSGYVSGQFDAGDTYSQQILNTIRANGWNYIWATTPFSPYTGQEFVTYTKCTEQIGGNAYGPLFTEYPSTTTLFSYGSYNWTHNVIPCSAIHLTGYSQYDNINCKVELNQLNLQSGEANTTLYNGTNETRYIASYEFPTYYFTNNGPRNIYVKEYNNPSSHIDAPATITPGTRLLRGNYIYFNVSDLNWMTGYTYSVYTNQIKLSDIYYTSNMHIYCIHGDGVFKNTTGYWETYNDFYFLNSSSCAGYQTRDITVQAIHGNLPTASGVYQFNNYCQTYGFFRPFTLKTDTSWIYEGADPIVPLVFHSGYAMGLQMFDPTARATWMNYDNGNYNYDGRNVCVPCYPIADLTKNIKIYVNNWEVPKNGNEYAVPYTCGPNEKVAYVKLVNPDTVKHQVEVMNGDTSYTLDIDAGATIWTYPTVYTYIAIKEKIIYNNVRVYSTTESTWKNAKTYVMNGSNWKEAKPYRYNGAEWVPI